MVFSPISSSPECEGCIWALGDRGVSGCTPLASSVLGVLGVGLGSSRYHFGLYHFGSALMVPLWLPGASVPGAEFTGFRFPPSAGLVLHLYFSGEPGSWSCTFVCLPGLRGPRASGTVIRLPFAFSSTAPFPWKAIPEHCCPDEEN